MADQNQSPASQASVALSGITVPLTIAGTPTWQAAAALSLPVGSPSVAVPFAAATGGGGGGVPALPSSGQIFPRGL